MGPITAHRVKRVLLFVLGLVAALRLGRAFFRLLLDAGTTGAIDLKLRHAETCMWFSGLQVYSLPRLTYPPATYALLFPVIGWEDIATARTIWALLSLFLTGVLAWTVWRIMDCHPAHDRLFAVLCVMASASLATTIGNGQLGLLVLAPLLLSLSSVAGRASAPALVVLMLIKPSSSLPFLWLFLWPAHQTTIALAIALYLFLSILAAHFQPAGLFTLVGAWLAQTASNLHSPGYANLVSLGRIVGHQGAGHIAGFILCLAGGVFVLRLGRKNDVWVSAGVLGIVARIWTYHRIYDDLLVLPALIALYRQGTAQPGCDKYHRVGRILLSLGVFSLLAPGQLRLLAAPWGPSYEIWQLLVWSSLLLYLCVTMLQAPSSSAPD